ncbi:hypothetical protein PUMCH_002058 [Australozyma saopauloensis]|uniref:Tuberous sclerosis 1 n=1 Tax=Australozyma saopauloensis TaxID=291208 RepID=A0AAX4H8F3_9ASCO|nr:hypothetical protein PUMCH_002058 [[Candida] saopauloensis]
MSGSSRSLLKALSSVFDTWDSNGDWRSSPSNEVKALYDVIYAYTDKHNSTYNLSSSINDELRNVYQEQIRNSDCLEKEIFFLDLLVRLLPLLTIEDSKLWLKSYLRPAIDTAGYDLDFVHKCQEFVTVLSDDSLTSTDSSLVQSRDELSLYIMERVLRIYIAKDRDAYKAIDLQFTDTEIGTQLHTERLRFLEKNCASILEKWCLCRPKMCFTLINKYFLDSESRLKVMALFTILSSGKKSQLQHVAMTPLYKNLLRSLCYDTSEAVLVSGLGILIMLMGKVCHKVSSYLPDLLVVYSRLLLWKTQQFKDQLSISKVQWSIVELNSHGSLMGSQHYSEESFNLTYLLTLLYGLFPTNLFNFFRSPASYWAKSPPQFISYEYLCKIDNAQENFGVFDSITSKSQPMVSRLMVHPNILKGNSPDDELENPISWILSSSMGEDVGEDEVLLACLKLNPEIMISLPDFALAAHGPLNDSASKRNSIGDSNDFRRLQKSYSAGNLLRDGIVQLEKLSSSNIDFLALNLKSKNFPTWNERRVSIVPTKLSLEHYASPARSEADNSEIQFHSFEFNPNKSRSDSETLDEAIIDPKRMGSIGDLFSEHEKLYSSTDGHHSNGQPVKEKNIENAVGSFQPSEKTASNLLSKQLRSDTPTEPKEAPTSSAGTVVDFYQRELLIMKNEVEFLGFVKNLNKLNYVKLKLQLNRLMLEESRKPPDNTSGDKAELKKLEEMILMMNLKSTDDAMQLSTQHNTLLAKIAELREQLEAKQIEFERVSQDLSEKETALILVRDKLTQTESERVTMANQLTYLLEQAQEKKCVEAEHAEFVDRNLSELTLTQYETERVQSSTELSLYKEKLNRALLECENTREDLSLATTRYNNELRLLKLNIGDSVREQTAHYERRVQELNRIVMRLETLLDDKDVQIAQLSRPNPIQIPRPSMVNPLDSSYNNWDVQNPIPSRPSLELGSMPRDYGFLDKRMPSFNSLSLSSTPMATTPQVPPGPPLSSNTRHNSLNNIPIIKGRGGYQKRSKKMM